MTITNLRVLIEEIVLLELTARTGPRTGGFELDPAQIETILSTVKLLADQVKNSHGKSVKKTFKSAVRDPVSGKTVNIPFEVYYDPTEKASAWFVPYQRGRGKIRINAKAMDDLVWLRSVIVHELTHLFDPNFNNTSVEGSDDFLSPHEQKAYLHQMIWEMTANAKRIAERVRGGAKLETDFARSIARRPLLLLNSTKNSSPIFRRLLSRRFEAEKEFMQKLYRATWDVVQAFIIPALEEITSPSPSA